MFDRLMTVETTAVHANGAMRPIAGRGLIAWTRTAAARAAAGIVPMPPSTAPLPRQNPPKASEYETAARILAWTVYLAYGFFARLWLLGLWIFGDLLSDAFNGWVIPALGFILLPWTTLTYACLWIIGSNQVSGWEWIVVGTALLVDYVFWAWSWRAFT